MEAVPNYKSFNTYCFKVFRSEKQPNYKAKGFSDRIFTIKCSLGNPEADMSEVINDAGDLKHQKLFREIEDLRKLLLIFRMIHYDDDIPDVQLSINNRDKQLCKPLIRLFNNLSSSAEIIDSLSRFLAEKNNKKLNSLDAYLYSIISDLINSERTEISNDELWNMILSLPGVQDIRKPHSYQSEEFGMISKTRITNICEDKFGDQRKHDGEKRSLVFDIKVIQRVQNNYSLIKNIEILDKSDTNTSNTFPRFHLFM